jgi:hypothetical protein
VHASPRAQRQEQASRVCSGRHPASWPIWIQASRQEAGSDRPRPVAINSIIDQIARSGRDLSLSREGSQWRIQTRLKLPGRVGPRFQNALGYPIDQGISVRRGCCNHTLVKVHFQRQSTIRQKATSGIHERISIIRTAPCSGGVYASRV